MHNGKSPQRNKKIQSPPKKRRKTVTEENAIKVIQGAYEIYHKYRVIVKEGGIKLILNTMKRHREDGRVQKNGRAALWYIARENADNHMAFGQGTHFCLGAQLARTELQLAMTTLLRRTDNWALVEGKNSLKHHPNVLLRGLMDLHISFDKVA